MTECGPRSLVIDLRTGVEREISGEEWHDLGHESSIRAPIWFSRRIVEFFRLMNNSEFIQLVREGLIGVYMVKIGIVARPVKLEPSKRFEIIRIFANHSFQIEVIAEPFHEFGIDGQLIPLLARQQIHKQRRLVGIGQISLEHGGKYLCTEIFPHIIHGFGIHQNIPFGK